MKLREDSGGIDRDLPARKHRFVFGMLLQMGSHAHEGLEVYALTTQTHAPAIAASEGTLRDDDRVGRVDAVLVDEHSHDVIELSAHAHGFDAAVANSELASPSSVKQLGSLLEQKSASFLVVGTPCGTNPEQRQRGELGSYARTSVTLDFVKDGSERIPLAEQATGGDENDSLARCRKRRQRGACHDGERKAQRTDAGAHARQQRTRIVRIACHESFVGRRLRRFREPTRAEIRRRARHALVGRRKALARKTPDLARPCGGAQTRLDGKLVRAGLLQCVERRRRVLRDLACGVAKQAPELIVRNGRVGPTRQSHASCAYCLDQARPLPLRVGRRESGQEMHFLCRTEQQTLYKT